MELKPLAIGIMTSVEKVDRAAELGASSIHLHAPSRDRLTANEAHRIAAECERLELTVTAVFPRFEGESYRDIPTVRRTVGLVPQATRGIRIAQTHELTAFVEAMGVGVVAMHLGFVPEDPANPDYTPLVEIVRNVCDDCAARGQEFHLETGQETAQALLGFIQDVERPNLGVNFDPANMILYGIGEPLSALRRLGAHVRSVHMKDAVWSDRPGETWGREVPLGEGDVNIPAFVRELVTLGYTGPLTIEREISGRRQFKDVRKGIALLERLREA
jgi:sugar phosphate isomerase/epimerase